MDFLLKETGAALRHSSEQSASGEDLAEGDGVEEAIIECNEDDSVDGIMVYYPIFAGRQVCPLPAPIDSRVLNSISRTSICNK